MRGIGREKQWESGNVEREIGINQENERGKIEWVRASQEYVQGGI